MEDVANTHSSKLMLIVDLHLPDIWSFLPEALLLECEACRKLSKAAAERFPTAIILPLPGL